MKIWEVNGNKYKQECRKLLWKTKKYKEIATDNFSPKKAVF